VGQLWPLDANCDIRATDRDKTAVDDLEIVAIVRIFRLIAA